MYRILALISILILPPIAEAAPRTFVELAYLFINIINGGIGVALILGLVIYFYGLATSIPELGKGGIEKLRAHFFWGITALFIMVSVWGILGVLRNTLFSGGGYDLGSRGDEIDCTSDCLIQ